MLRGAPSFWLTCGLIGLAGSSGCARSARNSVVIATTWPAAEQQALETAYRRWAESQASPVLVGPFVWVQLEPGADLDQVAARAEHVDVLVGEPVGVYARLGQAERLSPIERAGLPLWCVAKRSEVGLAIHRRAVEDSTLRRQAAGETLESLSMHGRLGFNDPRRDAVTFAFVKDRLRKGTWAVGYADLVLAASHARPIGRSPGSALASLDRGEASFAPAVADRVSRSASAVFQPLREPVAWLEGAALRRGAPHPEEAQAFLQFLADRDLGSGSPPHAADRSEADALLADLLGSTIVEAQDELRAAASALAWAQGDPAQRTKREAWLTQAPPWPPASVTQIERSDEVGPLLPTLAEQLAPDPEARAWLLKSWQAEPQPLDGERISELASAAAGRLAGEPRFRAWLRAEWTAWARQRYLAASRLTESEGPQS